MVLKKNPFFGIEYVQVKKSAFVGVNVNIKEGVNIVVYGATPAGFARVFPGGLLRLFVSIFTIFQKKKMVKEVAALLQDNF